MWVKLDIYYFVATDGNLLWFTLSTILVLV